MQVPEDKFELLEPVIPKAETLRFLFNEPTNLQFDFHFYCHKGRVINSSEKLHTEVSFKQKHFIKKKNQILFSMNSLGRNWINQGFMYYKSSNFHYDTHKRTWFFNFWIKVWL